MKDCGSWYIRTIIDRLIFTQLGGGSEAVFNLNCPAGPVQVRENFGFSRREIRHILAVLADRLVELCRAWEQIHGVA
ncbi:MAG: DUF4160 domain-containing protein [Bryobacteraceae bacterium]